MKVSNETRKPLTKNQKIIAIIFIIFGGLFVFNEFASRIDQEGQGKAESQRKYCDQLLEKNIHLYMEEEECHK